ncbi:MAG TPA: AmmeMemoRadiSam system protein B [Malonomonas sp.]
MIRQAVVAGSFYPANPAELQVEVERLLQTEQPPQAAKALIVPHAGYVFSGAVAGEVIAATKIPRVVLLLGPNHQGAGCEIAVTEAESWATPLGNVPIAAALRSQLCAAISDLQVDERAHQFEHSLEVMLPMLQHSQPQLQIVPIALRYLSLNQCLQLGSDLAAVLKQLSEEVLLLASSDMNHFKDAETTERLDCMAIKKMTDYDPVGLYQTVQENRISMCGVLPAVVVMQAARELGASRCRLLRHTHSGQVNGDNHRVVGYAALSIN